MSGSKIQADYKQLEGVVRAFAKETVRARRTHYRLGYATEVLRDLWQSEGAEAFLRDVDETILPAVERLAQAMHAGMTTTLEIITLMHTAEREAAAQLLAVETALNTLADAPVDDMATVIPMPLALPAAAPDTTPLIPLDDERRVGNPILHTPPVPHVA